MTSITSKLLPLAAAAMLATSWGPVLAQTNSNTTIQEGRVNINHTFQCGDDNDNATYQDGRVNINHTIQRCGNNRNQTAQIGKVNYNKTDQGRSFGRRDSNHGRAGR